MDFTGYLQKRNYSPRTIRTYCGSLNRFLAWLDSEGIGARDFDYNDLVAFIAFWRQREISPRTLNSLLGVIRHWCGYLIAESQRADNPAAGLFIRGEIRKLPVNGLSLEEMEELYQAYALQLQVESTRKVMLGLLVFQGLSTEELGRVQVSHFRQKEAKVFIPGTRHTKERWLKLSALQMEVLHGFLEKHGDQKGPVLARGRKHPVSEQNISNRIKAMMDQLHRLNPRVVGARQIRASVITHWLKGNNLRQVQYMAGHKYVSSTQRYQTSDLEDLQNQIQRHHPMS